jgi:chaperonin GroEL
MAKIIDNETGQLRLIKGVNKITEVVAKTLGPKGKAVAIQTPYGGPDVTRDGISVARSIELKDPVENMGAQMVKEASKRTEDLAGDGTSTSCILINEMVNRGHKAMNQISNINEVRSGMEKAVKYVDKFIQEHSIPVNGDMEKVRRVATISANNDPSVGDLICQAFGEVGFDGVVTADKSSGLETTVEVTKGFKVPKGWASPNFITNQADGTCVLDNPLIMVCSENITSVPQVLNILEFSVKSGQPLLLIVDSMADSVLVAILANTLNGALRCCVVTGPEFGDSRKNIMQDLATSTGATFICQEYGLKASEATPEMLGTAQKVVVSKDSCIVFEGAGDEEEIKARLDILKSRLSDPQMTDYEKTKLQTRIAGLGGGIGVIKVGGASVTAQDNLKATVEDAILASKSTIEEGAAVGGGYTLLQASKIDMGAENLSADEKIGADIVLSSLPIITKTIATNSGINGDVMLERIEVEGKGKENFGYNSKTGELGNLLEMGVLDSAKALRVSVENAVGAASMILLTDSVVYDEPEEQK